LFFVELGKSKTVKGGNLSELEEIKDGFAGEYFENSDGEG
jgi:hypothetical protein